MSDERPEVSRKIRRHLRQEAGFGCNRCGLPIFEYHHIVPWADVRKHDPAKMMLLCRWCHDPVTKKQVDLEDQWVFKRRPYNIERGYAGGMLEIQGHRLLRLGGNWFTACGTLLRVDGRSLLGAKFVSIRTRGSTPRPCSCQRSFDAPMMWCLQRLPWRMGVSPPG